MAGTWPAGSASIFQPHLGYVHCTKSDFYDVERGPLGYLVGSHEGFRGTFVKKARHLSRFLRETLISRGLQLKWSLENDFRSTNLGIPFSQWFHGAKDPNNAILKVLR